MDEWPVKLFYFTSEDTEVKELSIGGVEGNVTNVYINGVRVMRDYIFETRAEAERAVRIFKDGVNVGMAEIQNGIYSLEDDETRRRR